MWHSSDHDRACEAFAHLKLCEGSVMDLLVFGRISNCRMVMISVILGEIYRYVYGINGNLVIISMISSILQRV